MAINNVKEELFMLEGSQLELVCNGTGIPEPKLEWTQTGSPGNAVIDGGKVSATLSEDVTFTCK